MKTSLFQPSWADMKVACHKYQCRSSHGGGEKTNLQAVIHLNTACGGTIFKDTVPVTHLHVDVAAANDAARRPGGLVSDFVQTFQVVYRLWSLRLLQSAKRNYVLHTGGKRASVSSALGPR